MTINELKNFYYNYCPVFSERFTKNKTQFLFSNFVKDHFSNIAIVEDTNNLTFISKEFISRNLQPSFYSFKKPDKNFETLYTDNFLYYEHITKLYDKFKKFKSNDVSLILVNSEKLRNEYAAINDLCYREESNDNPYSNLDNFGYSKSVMAYQNQEKETKTLIYIIKYKSINVGCIILTIKNSLCYVSGLAILKEYRKTKVFTSMINVLDILIENDVSNIFCITESGEYPDKLYKKIGFKTAGTAYGFTFK